MYKLDEEKGYLVEDFKVFPGFTTFDDYVSAVKEEANYWKGYGPYLERKIRETQNYDALDDGMELVKKATSLRQTIYTDARLLAGLTDKYMADAPTDKRGRKMLTPEQVVALNAERKKIQQRIILKSFDLVGIREAFKNYLQMEGIEFRTKYSTKLKE